MNHSKASNPVNENYTKLKEDIAKKSSLLLKDLTAQGKISNRIPVQIGGRKTEDLRSYKNQDLHHLNSSR